MKVTEGRISIHLRTEFQPRNTTVSGGGEFTISGGVSTVCMGIGGSWGFKDQKSDYIRETSNDTQN